MSPSLPAWWSHRQNQLRKFRSLLNKIRMETLHLMLRRHLGIVENGGSQRHTIANRMLVRCSVRHFMEVA
jgi:hypothetical protein